MHRICDLAPEGHIVMIDPHGEYSAAFKGYGELFNVDNLAMPYWLMNFEEHCEVFITSSGAERQRDSDILAKCLLMARSKNRAAEGLTKLTVDSPIPYTLSDLTTAISSEMGLLNKATDTAPFMRLKTKIDELKADPRYAATYDAIQQSLDIKDRIPVAHPDRDHRRAVPDRRPGDLSAGRACPAGSRTQTERPSPSRLPRRGPPVRRSPRP